MHLLVSPTIETIQLEELLLITNNNLIHSRKQCDKNEWVDCSVGKSNMEEVTNESRTGDDEMR